MLENNDKQLWAAFIRGDEDALYQLYKVYVDTLYTFGLRFTDDSDLVKDCVQDLFIDLHNYRFTLAAEVNVKSYLFTSLKRKIFNILKRQAREESILETTFMLSTEDDQDLTHDDHRLQIQEVLKKQLDLLPDRQKEALYLRFNSELEYEEIAEIMNVSMATCRTLVYRGVKQLRERMVVKHVYKYLATILYFFHFISL